MQEITLAIVFIAYALFNGILISVLSIKVDRLNTRICELEVSGEPVEEMERK